MQSCVRYHSMFVTGVALLLLTAQDASRAGQTQAHAMLSAIHTSLLCSSTVLCLLGCVYFMRGCVVAKDMAGCATSASWLQDQIPWAPHICALTQLPFTVGCAAASGDNDTSKHPLCHQHPACFWFPPSPRCVSCALNHMLIMVGVLVGSMCSACLCAVHASNGVHA
jgi:hypothetical protein